MASNASPEPAWETLKENAKPLRRGRNPRELSKALSSQNNVAEKLELEKQRQRLEKRIKTASTDSDDPLKPWCVVVRPRNAPTNTSLT